jgi:hypothetical protein
MPPQQSTSLTQASLVCEQNELPAEQNPLRQAFEQHSEWLAHALPDVRQMVVMGVHDPEAPQLPLQH